MNLSAKNGWFDEKGRVYIIFPVNEVMEALVNLYQEIDKNTKNEP